MRRVERAALAVAGLGAILGAVSLVNTVVVRGMVVVTVRRPMVHLVPVRLVWAVHCARSIVCRLSHLHHRNVLKAHRRMEAEGHVTAYQQGITARSIATLGTRKARRIESVVRMVHGQRPDKPVTPSHAQLVPSLMVRLVVVVGWPVAIHVIMGAILGTIVWGILVYVSLDRSRIVSVVTRTHAMAVPSPMVGLAHVAMCHLDHTARTRATLVIP